MESSLDNLKKVNRVALLESLLFVAGEPVSLATIKETMRMDETELTMLLAELKEKHKNDLSSGIELQCLKDGYRLCTKSIYGEILKNVYAEPVGLSNAALETLAVIAFKAPVTKAEIEALRGVGSERSLMTLIEKDLVMECGRANLPGKPILYDVTPLFRRRSGWKALSAEEGAEEEIQGALDLETERLDVEIKREETNEGATTEAN